MFNYFETYRLYRFQFRFRRSYYFLSLDDFKDCWSTDQQKTETPRSRVLCAAGISRNDRRGSDIMSRASKWKLFKLIAHQKNSENFQWWNNVSVFVPRIKMQTYILVLIFCRGRQNFELKGVLLSESERCRQNLPPWRCWLQSSSYILSVPTLKCPMWVCDCGGSSLGCPRFCRTRSPSRISIYKTIEQV